MQPQSIPHFWFEELTAKQHFVKDVALDETVRARFGDRLTVIIEMTIHSRSAKHCP